MFDPSWFTPGMTATAEALALLSHASGTSSTSFTDNANDTLTLIGVSLQTLQAQPETIRFS